MVGVLDLCVQGLFIYWWTVSQLKLFSPVNQDTSSWFGKLLFVKTKPYMYETTCLLTGTIQHL